MNYSRQIHDYLDGELEFQKSESLFAEIAANPDVRADFNTQMKIHLVAKQDMSVISPPSSITNAVFTNLGFTPPISTNANISNEKVGAIPVVYNFIEKYSIALLLLLLFSSLSIGVYYAYQNSILEQKLNYDSNKSFPLVKSESIESSNDNSYNSTQFEANQTNLNSIDNSKNNQINSFSNNNKSGVYENNNTNLNQNSNSNNFSSKNTAVNNRKNSTLAANNFDIQNGINQDNKIASNTNFANKISISNIGNSIYKVKNSNFNSNPNNTKVIGLTDLLGSINSLFDSFIIDNTNYSVKIRNVMLSEKMPSYSITNNEMPFYSNFAIGGWYKLNSYHSIGIELGSEQFNQSFSLSNGLDYSQSPELFWAGISYRFAPKHWLLPYTLYPYSEVFVGGTSVGPLFRLQTGVNYMIYNNIGISLGLEYGTLYYNVENTIYNAQKFGITSGVNINF